jgi:hypothetical protein
MYLYFIFLMINNNFYFFFFINKVKYLVYCRCAENVRGWSEGIETKKCASKWRLLKKKQLLTKRKGEQPTSLWT